MIEKLKSSFDTGVGKVKGMASIFSERLKVEAAVIKLMRRSGDLDKERADLLKSIGERVFELRGRGDLNIYEDTRIRQSLGEVEKLDTEISELKKKASEISKVE